MLNLSNAPLSNLPESRYYLYHASESRWVCGVIGLIVVQDLVDLAGKGGHIFCMMQHFCGQYCSM